MSQTEKEPCIQKRIWNSLSNMNLKYKWGLILVASVLFVWMWFRISPRIEPHGIDVSAFNNDTKYESARSIVESNRDFLIFWAVLFFTCVVGIIELLSEFKESEYRKKVFTEKVLLFSIYFGLLGGILLSMSQGWKIYRISEALTIRDRLGPDVNQFFGKYPPLGVGFLSVWWEAIALIAVIVVFSALYFVKIGWLKSKH